MSSADGPAQPDKSPRAEEKHDSLKKRLSKPAAWTGGVLTALVVAAATAFGSGAVHRLFPPAHHSAPAVTIESSWLPGCGAEYLDETPAQAVASGNYSGVPEGGDQTIEIVNQTSSTERVVITGIRISLVARKAGTSLRHPGHERCLRRWRRRRHTATVQRQLRQHATGSHRPARSRRAIRRLPVFDFTHRSGSLQSEPAWLGKR